MAKKQKDYGPQSCIFCGRRDREMPVYSVKLGRLGICLDCAKEAVKALKKHQAKIEAAGPQYRPQSLFDLETR